MCCVYREASVYSDDSFGQQDPDQELDLQLQQLHLGSAEYREDEQLTESDNLSEGQPSVPYTALAERSVCQQFAASGACQRGSSCRHVHGMHCQVSLRCFKACQTLLQHHLNPEYIQLSDG